MQFRYFILILFFIGLILNTIQGQADCDAIPSGVEIDFMDANNPYDSQFEIPSNSENFGIPVFCYIVTSEGGTSSVTNQTVQTAITNSNILFADAKVEFYIIDIVTINNNELNNHIKHDNTQYNSYPYFPNAINMYFCDSVKKTNGSPICGYAGFPHLINSNNLADKIFISSSSGCLVGNTPAHELGHFFGLFHLHQGVNCERENNQCPMEDDCDFSDFDDSSDFDNNGIIDCYEKNDRCCDTPVSFRLGSDIVNNSCNLTCSDYDADFDINETVLRNLMSYTRKNPCRAVLPNGQNGGALLTQEQHERILFYALNSRYYLIEAVSEEITIVFPQGHQLFVGCMNHIDWYSHVDGVFEIEVKLGDGNWEFLASNIQGQEGINTYQWNDFFSFDNGDLIEFRVTNLNTGIQDVSYYPSTLSNNSVNCTTNNGNDDNIQCDLQYASYGPISEGCDIECIQTNYNGECGNVKIPISIHVGSQNPNSPTDAQINNTINLSNTFFATQGIKFELVIAGNINRDVNSNYANFNGTRDICTWPDGSDDLVNFSNESYLNPNVLNLLITDNIAFQTYPDTPNPSTGACETTCYEIGDIGGFGNYPDDGNISVIQTTYFQQENWFLLCHEIGHMLGLYHTFTSCELEQLPQPCHTQDRIWDTPHDDSATNPFSGNLMDYGDIIMTLPELPNDVTQPDGIFISNCQVVKMTDVLFECRGDDLYWELPQPTIQAQNGDFTTNSSYDINYNCPQEIPVLLADLDDTFGSNTANCIEWEITNNGNLTVINDSELNLQNHITAAGSYQIKAIDKIPYNNTANGYGEPVYINITVECSSCPCEPDPECDLDGICETGEEDCADCNCQETYSIDGTVTNISGQSMEGVAVNLSGQSTVYTDASGYYILPNLCPTTSGTVNATISGYTANPECPTCNSINGLDQDVVVNFTMAANDTGGNNDNGGTNTGTDDPDVYSLFWPFSNSYYTSPDCGSASGGVPYATYPCGTNGWSVSCHQECGEHHSGDTYAQDWNRGSGNSDCGEIIYAPLQGTILFAGWTNNPASYGQQVVIQSSFDASKVFKVTHLESIDPAIGVGQTVFAGTPIGTLGNSGSGLGGVGTFTCHAHAVMHKNLNNSDISILSSGGWIGSPSKAQRFEFDHINSLSIITPTANDCFTEGGEPIEITWNEDGTIQNIVIELCSTDGWCTVISANEPNDGDAWHVIDLNETPPGTYFIKIYDEGSTLTSTTPNVVATSNNFSIEDCLHGSADLFPDLTPQNAFVSTNLSNPNTTLSVNPGDQLNFVWDIQNIGQANASPSMTKLWFSTDANLDGNDMPVGQLPAGSIGVDNSLNFNQVVNVPNSASPGLHYFIVQVNGESDFVEYDFNNNTEAVPVQVLDNSSSGTCPEPTGVSVAQVLNTSITIDWLPQSGAISYGIGWREQGTSTWESVAANTPPYTIENLASCTTYEISIGTICSPSEASELVAISAQTTGCGGNNGGNQGGTCATPTGLYADDITDSDFELHWSSVPGAISYNLTVTGFGVNISETTTETSWNNNYGNIDPCTEYTFTVTANCGNGNLSNAATGSFTTINCPGNLPDLTLNFLDQPGSSYSVGQPISISFQVQNIGSAPTYFYSFTDVVYDNDDNYENGYIDIFAAPPIGHPFAPGDSQLEELMVHINQEGCYFIHCFVDAYGNQEELNENNNIFSFPVEIGDDCSNGGGGSGGTSDNQVTYPNGGETLLTGQNHTITWETMGCSSVTVEFSLDNGNTWDYVSQAHPDDGDIDWPVIFTYPTQEALVRVTCNDDTSLFDTSDAVFTIVTDMNTPANDEPCGAIPLTVEALCDFQTFTTTGATPTLSSVAPVPSCDGWQASDVWFSVTVPSNGGFTVQTESLSFHDGFLEIYQGNCSNLQTISCDDDSGEGSMPQIAVSNLTPGTTVYIRFWYLDNAGYGDFNICISDCPLQITGFQITEASCNDNDGSIENVIFTGNNGQINNFSWTNEGGTILSTNSELHNVPFGVYNLTISDEGGCSTSRSIYLNTIEPIPSPDFSYTLSGLTASFSNSTDPTFSYEWYFDDGSTSSIANPTHNFPSVGNYTVCLTISNVCGNFQECQDIFISENDCYPPTNFQTLSNTETSATISWNNTGALSYDISYAETGTTNWININNYSGTNLNINDLSSATSYQLEIISNCATGVSISSQTYYFSTAANSANLTTTFYKKYDISGENDQRGYSTLLNNQSELLMTSSSNVSGVNRGFFSKIDVEGNLLWSKRAQNFSSSSQDSPGTPSELVNGDLIYNFIPNNAPIVQKNCFATLSASGQLLWEKHYGISNQDFSNFGKIIELPNGDLLRFFRKERDVEGTFDGNHSADNIVIMRLNASGNIIWSKELHHPLDYHQEVLDILLKPNGNIIIIGLQTDYDNPGFQDYQQKYDGLIIEFDLATQNIVWSKTVL